MFKLKMVRRFIVICLMVVQCCTSFNFLVGQGLSKKRVLLVYDAKSELESMSDKVFVFSNLLSHFDVTLEIKHESEVIVSEIEDYDYFFILSNEGTFSNYTLLKKLADSDKTVCWIGVGLESYNKYLNYPVAFKGIAFDYTKVYYNNGNPIISLNQEYSAFSEYIPFELMETTNDKVEVYCQISNGSNFNPYIMKYNNFWYITSLQIWGDLFYIVSDVLYSIFEVTPASDNTVFIRIEDVHPFRSQRKLRAIADYLHSEGIPFMVALIPAFTSPKGNYTSHLDEVPGFVETIKYMISKGASIVMHGYTHAGYGEVSGEGFEFWDGINNRPIQDVNEVEYIHNRIYKGLKKCVENEIYPLAFEPPHYAISITGYEQVSNYFSTYCGQVQGSNIEFSTITYPYELIDTKYFNYVIPENLGYIYDNYSIAVQEIIDNYYSLSKVRGYTAGMFFHPNIRLKYLKELVSFFKQQNLEFYDLRLQSNWVNCEDIFISSENGAVTAKHHMKTPERSIVGIYFSYFNLVLVGALVLIMIIFLLIYFRAKRDNRLRFTKRPNHEA